MGYKDYHDGGTNHHIGWVTRQNKQAVPIWVVVSSIFCLFSPQKLGKFPILTNIFSLWLKPPTSYFLHSPKLTYIAPENSWLEDDPFLLGKPIHGSFGKHPAEKTLHRTSYVIDAQLCAQLNFASLSSQGGPLLVR